MESFLQSKCKIKPRLDIVFIVVNAAKYREQTFDHLVSDW